MTNPDTRLSSTVLLVKDDPDLKVLMVARHYQIDFASGALVFPGGKVCDDDYRPEWSSESDGDFSGDDLAARVAAVREVFEESGILLARDKTARGKSIPLVTDQQSLPLAQHRHAVDRGEMSFLDLMVENGLVLALDRLVPFAHWITPTFMPKRFDTHFYIAKAPVGQTAKHDGRETTDAIWINPADALEQEKAGKATIIFPTRMNVEMLSRSSDAEAALADTEARQIVTVLPEVTKNDEGLPILKIPSEADYCVTEEPLESVQNEHKKPVRS